MIERTNFKSVSEFNNCFEDIINILFDEYFDELNKDSIKYNIYLINRKLSIIINIYYNKLFEQNTELRILTIENGLDTNVEQIIKINDNWYEKYIPNIYVNNDTWSL